MIHVVGIQSIVATFTCNLEVFFTIFDPELSFVVRAILELEIFLLMFCICLIGEILLIDNFLFVHSRICMYHHPELNL